MFTCLYKIGMYYHLLWVHDHDYYNANDHNNDDNNYDYGDENNVNTIYIH